MGSTAFLPYIKLSKLLEVCHSGLEQFHILLSVDIHGYCLSTSFGMSHLSKYSTIRAGDFGYKRNLCLSFPTYPCRKEWKGLVRIHSQSSLFSFLAEAAQAGAWISSRFPKLKRERQQLVAGTNEAFAEFVRSSTFFSITPGWIRLNRRVEEKRITAAANLFA